MKNTGISNIDLNKGSNKIIMKHGSVFIYFNVAYAAGLIFFLIIPYLTKLEKNAFCLITDSGTVPEESLYFKVPSITIRETTERPEFIEAGFNVISGLEFVKVSLNFIKLNAMILENHKIIHIHFQSRELTH